MSLDGKIPTVTVSNVGEVASLDFGTVKVGSCCKLAFAITNSKSHEYPIHVLELKQIADMGIEVGYSIPIQVPANDTINVQLNWRPTNSGVLRHVLLLQAAHGKAKLILSGKANGPKRGKAVESYVARFRKVVHARTTW